MFTLELFYRYGTVRYGVVRYGTVRCGMRVFTLFRAIPYSKRGEAQVKVRAVRMRELK